MASDTYKAFLELEARVSGMGAVQKAVASVDKTLVMRMDSRGFREISDQMGKVQSMFKDLDAGAANLGLKFGDTLEDAQKKMEQGLSASYGDLFDLQQRLVQAQGAGDAAREQHVQGLISHQRIQMQQEMQNAEGTAKIYSEIIKERQAAVDAEAQATRELEDAKGRMAEREQRGFADKAEDFSQEFGSIWGRAASKDLPGVFNNLGKLFARGAAKGADQATVAGAGGDGAGVLGELSGSLGGIAKALGAFAAVAGVIAAVVTVLNSLDEQIKETNKSILEGSSIADLYWGDQYKGAAHLSEGLNSVRGALHDFSSNVAWRTTADEQAAIIAAFQESGYAIKEMTGDLENQVQVTRDLRKATAAAMTYAQLLGETDITIASQMGESMEEMALGIDSVREGYSTTYRAAMLSGFGTKRFYSMVQQATAGMALYNVRMEDAANLMLTLSKVMSPRAAAAMLQSLSQGFSQKSIQERIKTMMVSGYASSMQVLEMDAARFGERFMDEFSGSLQAAGLDVSGGAEGVRKQLDTMTTDQQALLTANLAALGDNGKKAAQQLGALINLSNKGDGMIASAIASGSMSAAGQMVAQLQMFGKPLYEIQGENLAAYQEQMGFSGQQVEEMRALSRLLYGSFKALESGQEGVATTEAEMIEQIRKFGGYLGPDGVMVGTIKENKVINAHAAETWQGFAMGQDELIAATVDGVSEDEARAQEMIQNTRQIASLIETGTNFLLNWIGGMLDGIWTEVLGGEERREEIEAAEGRAKALAADSATKANEIKDLEQKLKTTEGAGRIPIEEAIAAATAEGKTLSMQQQYEEMFSRSLRTVTSGDAGVATRKAQERMAETGGLEGIVAGSLGAEKAAELAAQAKAESAALEQRWAIYQQQSMLAGGMSVSGMPETAETESDILMRLAEGELKRQTADQVTASKDTTAAVDQLNDDAVSNIVKANKISEAQQMLRRANYQGKDFASFAENIATGNAQALLRAQGVVNRATMAGTMDPILGDLAKGLSVGAPQNDFIYRRGGKVTPINTQDDIMGFKPGGPIAGAGGGGGVININVNGGDQAQVYNTVKRAIKSSGRRT